jgi:pimeloyl-ACP methyl ester carboxylesterase
MSTFGLVHGGGFGSWCWERLIPELQALGYHAATVDLTPEDQEAGAAHCATLVEEAFESIDDLVLVGHSLAGLITPLVAAAHRLVFLHALLPRPGHSVVDQLGDEPDMFNPDIFAVQTPFWEDEEVANYFLFHDCANEVAHDAFRQLRLEPGVLEPGVLGREVTPVKGVRKMYHQGGEIVYHHGVDR